MWVVGIELTVEPERQLNWLVSTAIPGYLPRLRAIRWHSDRQFKRWGRRLDDY
jgi:hypothetical protein